MNLFTVGDAIDIAVSAHAGQKDKAGRDYISHPVRVMASFSTPLAKMVAVLHDVIEDTPIQLEDLSALGCPEQVLVALAAITHPPGEPNVDYWARVKANPLARQVKLADIADNSREDRLVDLDEATATRLRAKYERALAFLA